jgi:uncharacterized protein (UPF0333 family)
MRGQISVEFFLVAAFLVALAAGMLVTAQGHLSDAESLRKATMSKAAVDSVAAWVNAVYLQGSGAQVSGSVFIPAGSVCLILSKNGADSFFECDAHPSIEKRVSSSRVLATAVEFLPGCPPQNPAAGWFNIKARNAEGVVRVSCEMMP